MRAGDMLSLVFLCASLCGGEEPPPPKADYPLVDALDYPNPQAASRSRRSSLLSASSRGNAGPR